MKRTTKHREHSVKEDCAGSVMSYGWTTSVYHYTGRFQISRPAKVKVERHNQEGPMKNGTHSGRGGSSSPQQTRISEYGPMCSHTRGLNQRQGR